MTKKVESFKGFEHWFNRLKMEAKMQTWTFITLFVVHMILFIVCIMVFLPDGAMGYLFHYLGKSLFPWNRVSGEEIYTAGLVLRLMEKYLFLTALVYFLYPVAFVFFKKKAKELEKKEHVRGSKIVESKVLIKQLRKEPTRLTLGEIPFPVNAEPKHALVIGRPGSGKTVCLSSIIEKLLADDQRGIIYDFKGDYLSRFYREGTDLIFNPLDVRSIKWNLFADIKTKMDIEAISNSLIPPGQSSDTEKFFADAARSVFAGILHHCIQTGKTSNKDIWENVMSPTGKIADILGKQESRGYIYIQDGGSKQALGVHSTLMQYAQAFEYMSQEGDFSLTGWLESGRPGFIFVTNYSDLKDTLRPILSLFVDLISRKLLAFPDDLNRRFYVMLDEFGTLQRLSSIVQLLTLSRSKGGSVWLGIQDTGQVDKVYQKELRQAITNACATSVMFSVADSETAEFLSKRVGEQEIWETEEAQSMGPEDMRDGISISRKKKTEKVVLSSEFLNLPDLNAYVKIPNYDLVKTVFQWKARETVADPVVLRSDLII